MKRIGHWNKVRRITNRLQKDIKKAQGIALKRWGLLAERIAVLHISKQDLGWVPLEPKTITAKVNKGYSENILTASSTYFQSITSYVDGDTVYAGVKKDVKYEGGGSVANIAAVHEFGTEHIPARPLWRPTLEEVVEKIRTDDKLNPTMIFAKRFKI